MRLIDLPSVEADLFGRRRSNLVRSIFCNAECQARATAQRRKRPLQLGRLTQPTEDFCCGAARRFCRSLRQRASEPGEFTQCGTKGEFAAHEPMAAFSQTQAWPFGARGGVLVVLADANLAILEKENHFWPSTLKNELGLGANAKSSRFVSCCGLRLYRAKRKLGNSTDDRIWLASNHAHF